MSEQPPTTEPAPYDRIEQVDLQLEMQRSYLDYAMSVIVGRALPDVRDGLKPVHRRILYAMYDGGYRPDRQFSKCSRVVGDVMGQYHPHGDGAIYDALVRLAQPWSLRYPLVAGQGNFGSPGNDPAAAPRYTECRMAPLAMEMVRDIDEETVDFGDNYDGRTQEPQVLPARFPNLLVNGSAGIAVGMATNIPPHNLREVAVRRPVAAGATRRRPRRSCSTRCWRGSRGPDFPTGALIMGKRGIDDAYRTGRGQITMRAVVEVEEIQNRTCLVVTELPYQVNPDNLALKIAELVKDGRLAGIADIRDETSGRTGQRLVIVLKRDAVATVVLNNLYKHTQLQDTFGANMLALVDGVPRTLSLDSFVRLWVEHQVDVIVRAHPVPAAQGPGADAHRRRAAQGARRPRRGDRADPRVGHGRRRARRADGAARDRRRPGGRDPRHAAAPARGPGAAEAHRGARRARGADHRLRGHPRLARAPAADHRRGAGRDRRAVRRRAPHHDRPVRRRHVERGPHPGRGRRRHDHPRRLRQAHPGRLLPLAEARRQGRARAPRCAATTRSSTSSPPRPTTGCCSSPTSAGSTGPRRTSCPSRRATPRASTWRTCWRSSRASRSPRS